MRKFKLWSPSPEGKLACHLCRLSSHSHHPWKIEWRKAARDEGREEKKSESGNMRRTKERMQISGCSEGGGEGMSQINEVKLRLPV